LNLEFPEIQKLIRFHPNLTHPVMRPEAKRGRILNLEFPEVQKSHPTELDASVHVPPQARAWQSLGVRTRIPLWLPEKKSKWAVFPVMM
jgi:hypothetical protein